MKITLAQNDLDAAIFAYAQKNLGIANDATVSSKFSLSGRNRDIVTAEVEILPPGVAPSPVAEVEPEATQTQAAAEPAAATDGGVFS